jgi:hypothetical protein
MNLTQSESKPKKEISLTRECGTYTVQVDARKGRLPIEKEIFENGRFVGTRTCFIPMTQVAVNLLHNKSADLVIFKLTAMGRKVGITRTTSLDRAKVVNKAATGPEFITTGTGKESYTLDRAVATVARMTGLSLKEAALLFDYEAVSALV